jgi:hypothetical protein
VHDRGAREFIHIFLESVKAGAPCIGVPAHACAYGLVPPPTVLRRAGSTFVHAFHDAITNISSTFSIEDPEVSRLRISIEDPEVSIAAPRCSRPILGVPVLLV